MAGPSKPLPDKDRDERLAAALRENLKRRKAQARSLQDKNKPSPPELFPEEKTGG
jgi:hypothetical protein